MSARTRNVTSTTKDNTTYNQRRSAYSVKNGAAQALAHLSNVCQHELPSAYVEYLQKVTFDNSCDSCADMPLFPCPLKEQEATAAIRALEASAASAIADLRYSVEERCITVDITKVGCFLMSTYMTSVDAIEKGDPRLKNRIPDTDINRAQSILYRRLSANLYQTKNSGEYYHIHGSLDATKTLEMLGLEAFRPDLRGYRDCLRTIGEAVRRFTIPELEELNAQQRQAGAPALKRLEFSKTSHARALSGLPPFTVQRLEAYTSKAPFSSNAPSSRSQALQGVRVLEVCRVIAGPTIGRCLAAHGADVLKVTSPDLPDVPFFQIDVNLGKHTTALDLRNPGDRIIFEDLLETADVLIDGYRPGALTRLGYGPEILVRLAKKRGKGIVYVTEDCFGGSGLPPSAGAVWAARPGWQQIADCVTGVAWEQGRFLGLDEPVVPPFPMSDYGTGALGCVAALTGLYRRATQGGSWICRTSLVQYDLFLLSLGLYPVELQKWLRKSHDPAFFDLRHDDSVDEVGRRALHSMRRLHPHLFTEGMMQRAWSAAYGGIVAWPREAITIHGLRVGHVRSTRPNGFDGPTWEGWEVDGEVARG